MTTRLTAHTGLALYLGEWVALPAFSLAFARYLSGLVPGFPPSGLAAAKVLLIVGVTATNLRGIRTGGRTNDVLTMAKLLPLAILIVAGLGLAVTRPGQAAAHLQPFAPMGWTQFGAALVLIFWAYAGFELAVLPAGEVRRPRRTLPHGLLLGVSITTGFYLLTSAMVVITLPWQVAAASPRPLADALGAILSGVAVGPRAGQILMSLGALVSIAGVYEVFTLGLARLSYAMAADGLLPGIFARLRGRSGTPYAGLIFQAGCALILAFAFNIAILLTTAVFFVGLCYASTALAAWRLLLRHRAGALHVPGLQALLLLAAVSGVYLSTQASPRVMGLGLLVMGAGAASYLVLGRSWQGVTETRIDHHLDQPIEHWPEERHAWLLHLLRRGQALSTAREKENDSKAVLDE